MAVNNVIILLIIFIKLIAVQIYSTVTECFRTENKIFIIFELFMKGFIKLNIFFSIWFGYLLNDASGSPLRQLMIYGYESVM